MIKQFINLNGSIVSSDHQIFTVSNRGFRYGDGLFESMRYMNGQLKFPDLHIDRVLKGMKILKLENSFHLDSWFLREKVEELARRNKIGPDARFRLTVFRDSGGLYSPESNKMAYVLECQSMDESQYTFNNKGLIIDVYDELTKSVNILSNLKTCNSLIYVLAGIFKNQYKLDEVMILNQHGFLCESISSNVFVVYDSKLYTPSLNEGCIGGVMRQVVMRLAIENGIELIEAQVNPDILNEADEVFITNAAKGIQWVMGYNSKRYFNEMSKFLSEKLNLL
ncbi:aminotransferase class IV [Daejeonella sp.]|jgi:branched-chain amino acid aminotransferase|uniref:aminotransferase class IV n=1 Tax=Daejeonella sp. TaxID=2805397 RepID=UPI0027B9947A|nr:aminotransferase class IV [Daejeonella sp.]